ncbi:hypothetical protein TNCT_312661, partial [Trichonephila clavata]
VPFDWFANFLRFFTQWFVAMETTSGLLNESVCKKPVQIRTDPISDHYTVEARPFARGKFATVRRCRHKASGTEYAAKSMRKRRRAADVRHEILHEAHVLELSAHHTNIVQLHEVFETPSEIVLVLELVPGGELQRVLDDEEVVPEREAARLLKQILSGVAFLHDHNIAHLDLKPQNLLLTKPFPDCEVKLCDFGISRLITKGIEVREILGTPDYVAPEVLHYEPISLSTDMWSLGVLTYVLLSGHSPFGGDTKQETFCNITRGELEFPNDLFGHISNSAKDFIQRLLVRDPRERMSAEESLSHPWLKGNTPPTPGIQLTLTPDKSPAEASSPRLLDNTYRKNSSGEVKASPTRNVDRMVAQFEGLSMTKRIVFSEEIIVDERVSMVY